MSLWMTKGDKEVLADVAAAKTRQAKRMADVCARLGVPPPYHRPVDDVYIDVLTAILDRLDEILPRTT